MIGSWETLTLIVGALVGVGKLLWDVLKRFINWRGHTLSEKNSRRVEEQRIQSEEDRLIYKDLRDRVNRQDKEIRKIRDDLHEWKDQYYELHTTSQEMKVQNKILSKSNKKLQRALNVLRSYLQKITTRLSDYEDIPAPPQVAQDTFAMGIDEEILDDIANPNIDTSDVLGKEDIPDENDFGYNEPPSNEPPSNDPPSTSENGTSE